MTDPFKHRPGLEQLNAMLSGTAPGTRNTAPAGALSWVPTLPANSCPAGVENTSAAANGATSRRIWAVSQLPGSAASHSW